MKIRNQAILLSLVALGLGACSEDNPWASQRGKGGIDLKLSASADVKDAIPLVRSGVPELAAPDAANFAIELRNMETDMAQTWQTLEDFNAEGSFDVGVYTLTAFYGNEHECGFDKPYFKGEATVNVFEGRETAVEVTAELANSMLSIDYTDEFKAYFADYSVTAHTAGESMVNFSSNETRAGFVTPGEVVLELALVKPGGESTRINASTFPAAARHHYHVTFNVNADPVGGAAIVITFDDSLTQEDVKISLTDELFTSEGPMLTPNGFTPGEMVEVLSGNMSETPLKFEAICKGGIKSAVLTVAADGSYTPPFGREVELVGANEALQAQLEQNGVKVAGIFKNPAEMAVVDVTSLSRYLPEGNYQVSLRVTDKLDRVSDPVTLALATRPVVLNFIEGSAIYSYPGNEITDQKTVDATVKVSYNGINPQSNISFQNKCRTGVYKNCEVVSVEESTRTRAFEEKTYIFHIRVCDAETSPLPMRMLFHEQQWGDDFTIDVVEPKFTLEADPFATYARFRVVAEDPAQTATIANGLTIYRNDQAVAKERLKVDAESGILTLIDLASDQDYKIAYSLTNKVNGVPAENTFMMHTEAAAQIPNRAFTEIERTINQSGVNAGGQYKYGFTTMQNKSSIVVDTPVGWATLNPLTCWFGASNVNTWFCVPSTLMSGTSVLIRTVAYDHAGVSPELDNHGAAVRAKYSRNKPASFASKASGELFLGTYSFDGTESRTDGIAFTSRPSSVTLDYSYTPVAGEVGELTVALVGADGSVLCRTSADITSSSTTMTVQLPAYPFGVKAAGIRLSVKSSKEVIDVPVPSDIQDVSNTTSLSGQTIPANQYKSLCVGSQLLLKSVNLNY
ncbi:MAG: DUF4493 domain-containing protein [Muribaculaceae bacterium]|nr:DUF4493 domain-containing protein [Muribaculaceae bacterium]